MLWIIKFIVLVTIFDAAKIGNNFHILIPIEKQRKKAFFLSLILSRFEWMKSLYNEKVNQILYFFYFTINKQYHNQYKTKISLFYGQSEE